MADGVFVLMVKMCHIWFTTMVYYRYHHYYK